jgi:hypothetical protein
LRIPPAKRSQHSALFSHKEFISHPEYWRPRLLDPLRCQEAFVQPGESILDGILDELGGLFVREVDAVALGSFE